MRPASGAVNDMTIPEELSKFTTSSPSDTSNIDSILETSFSYVWGAISGFIPSEIREASTFKLQIEILSPWTVGSDTQRYKQCGNAVTVNVVRHVASKVLETA
jgi:site-specific DNA-cytosine methylase